MVPRDGLVVVRDLVARGAAALLPASRDVSAVASAETEGARRIWRGRGTDWREVGMDGVVGGVSARGGGCGAVTVVS